MKKKMMIFSLAAGIVLSGWMSGKLSFAEGMVDDIAVSDDVEVAETVPEIYIKAINPGYTVDGVNNVGEMIEIGLLDSDASISLAGITISYTNSSGNTSTLVEFPEHSFVAGGNLLLRLASTPESELANLNYTKTLAFKAGIALMRGEEVLDAVCWTSKDECYKEFKSSKPTVLVRNLETDEFEHELVADYEPAEYRAENYYVEDIGGMGAATAENEVAIGHCKGLEFAEILSYYETSKSEQFIEIHNASAEQVLPDGCVVKYKNKKYKLTGILPPDGYLAYSPDANGFSLTKNPTNSNTLEIVDVDGVVVDSLTYPNGQRKGTSYALIGYDSVGEEIWKVTYAPTPGAPNNYQEYKTCEEGKVINEATGNCVKVTAIATKICPAGQYLNILTGRCKKYITTAEKTCKEGYYLNPETGRCRKIVENNGSNYGVEVEEYKEEPSFVGLYAVLGVVGVGVLYVIYEFRKSIARFFKRAWERVRRR